MPTRRADVRFVSLDNNPPHVSQAPENDLDSSRQITFLIFFPLLAEVSAWRHHHFLADGEGRGKKKKHGCAVGALLSNNANSWYRKPANERDVRSPSAKGGKIPDCSDIQSISLL